MTTKVKRCVYCGGDDHPMECGQLEYPEGEVELTTLEPGESEFPQVADVYVSNFGKKRPKPQDKMRRAHEDK